MPKSKICHKTGLSVLLRRRETERGVIFPSRQGHKRFAYPILNHKLKTAIILIYKCCYYYCYYYSNKINIKATGEKVNNEQVSNVYLDSPIRLHCMKEYRNYHEYSQNSL